MTMPINNETVTCINHPNEAMKKNDGFYAFVSFKKDGDKCAFEHGSGIPVATYYCSTCGYIENYAAQFDEKWNTQ
jgi:hypothetical protein